MTSTHKSMQLKCEAQKRHVASLLYGFMHRNMLSRTSWKIIRQQDWPELVMPSQAVQPMDPRIHFALVCGAKSCPPIKVYTAISLQEGLESATTAFCEGKSHLHRGAHDSHCFLCDLLSSVCKSRGCSRFGTIQSCLKIIHVNINNLVLICWHLAVTSLVTTCVHCGSQDNCCRQ